MKRFNSAKLPIISGIVIGFLLVLTLAMRVYFDYLAFKEIGENFLEVFFTDFKVKLLFQGLSFVLVFLIFYLSISILKKNLLKIDSVFDFLKNKYVILIGSLVFSFVASGIIQAALNDEFLMFKNSVSVGINDPVFYKDIGYYLFQRPFLMSLTNSFLVLFTILFFGILFVYMFLYARLGISNVGSIFSEKGIMTHNVINLSLLILVKIISFTFGAEEMLYNINSSFTGAGYTDVNIWKLYFRVIPYVLLVVTVIAVILFLKGKKKAAIITFLIYPVTYLGFGGVAYVTDVFVVKPSEVSIESPYISNNIEYTRKAYGIDHVDSEVFDIDYNLTGQDLSEENNTVSNTRIIDYPSTLKAVNQVQSIRNYYNFIDLDIVKYDISGKPTAVGIATREFNSENIAESSKSFINERLRFTHGYGVAAVSVNSVTKEGQPEFLVKDIPTESSVEELKITQPRIYYGEKENDYVIANSKYKELDYSLGDTDVEYSYTGDSGIKMTPFNKVLYAAYLGDFQLLISNYVDSESRLLINTNVLRRVKTVAPFLTVDEDPYMVIDDDGSLKWIVNCYTTSSFYPYSKRSDIMNKELNYVRESVKAVVNAYNGEVKFYITDKDDVIARVYNKIYPSFFEKEDMPDGLSTHLQYPEAMFKLQSEVIKRFHTKNPEIFYNKTDLWDYAKEKYQGEEQYVSPYYSIMKTFSDKGSLVLMIPYTMSGKQNLVSWLAVNCDKEGYGDMKLYTFPKGENIYGTLQIENKIDNDPEISREMTLWGQGGSTVIRGNMLTIPVKNSLIYIEPVYISSGTQSSLPELKRIIVAYKDNIVMEETLEKALYKIFDFSKEPVETPEVPKEPTSENPTPDLENTVPDDENKTVVELYDKLKEAMQNGDWATFGEAFSKLEEEINKLR